MSDLSGQYQKLPPGWDCKYDQNTGSCYYVNYFTKVMQLEDPRTRYKQLQNERCSTESIPMQQMHGSGSPYHVYPTNIPPMVRAFQTPNTSLNNMSTTPLLSSRAQLHELSPLPFLKSSTPSQTPLMGNMGRRSTIQETSFTNPNDTDAVVAKMQNMFPTASENHIRLLLKKYMKNIFPKADETLLLDILANSDNNVQKASETLLSMGYAKKDFMAVKVNTRPNVDGAKKPGDEQIIPLRPKEYTPEEKEAMEGLLKEKYPHIPEKIILMALESVNYAEDRAIQILQIVQDEEDERLKKQQNEKLAQEMKTKMSLIDETDVSGIKNTDDKADYITWNGANPDISYGHKTCNVNGPDQSLRIERSYQPLGRNPELCKGPNSALAKGSIYAQLSVTASTSKGPNIKCN